MAKAAPRRTRAAAKPRAVSAPAENNTAIAQDTQPAAQVIAAVPKELRRKRASAGGMKMRLDAPSRSGYVRRWVQDDPSRIASMQELGYQFADEDTRTDGLGARVTRQAGKDENGRPNHLVLMETPDSEYAVGVAEKEERLAPFEQALKAGQDTTGQIEGAYRPAASSSLTHSG